MLWGQPQRQELQPLLIKNDAYSSAAAAAAGAVRRHLQRQQLSQDLIIRSQRQHVSRGVQLLPLLLQASLSRCCEMKR